MKVKQKLKISSIEAIIMVLLIFIVLLLGLHEIKRAVRAAALSTTLITGAFERNALRIDYAQTGSERAKRQWFGKHEQIGVLLKSASDIFDEPGDMKTIQDLIKDHETTGILFSDLESSRESAVPQALVQDKQDRLNAQLNMRLYKKIHLINLLRESADRRLSYVLTLSGLGIVFGLVILIAAVVINAWTMSRTIVERVQRVRNGASVIGEGDLDHVIDIRGNDEFSELSEAINAMTAKLRTSYQDLGSEIERRSQAEEELEHQMEAVWHGAMEFDAIFKVLPYFVSVIGKDGRYLRVNPAMVNFYGLDFSTAAREEIARRLGERVPAGREMTAEVLLSNRALNGETVKDAEYLIADEKGEEHVFLGNAVPLKLDGEVYGAVLAHIDITDRKRAEDALLKAHDKLEERVRQRTRELQEAVVAIEAEGLKYRELNETLEQRIMERTSELQDSNENLRVSRRAAMNLMEDALAARRKAEQASEELREVMAARMQAEEELRKSEERLRLHTENSPTAVVEWDAGFVITRWAGEAELVFGWSAEEVLGMQIMDLHMVYEEDLPIIEQTMSRLTDGKTRKVVSSNRNYTRDGRIIDCEWYNSVIRDEGGTMISVMSQVLDVTRRKEVEKALQESEQRLRLFVEHAPAAIAMFDRSMRYIAVSRRWFTDYGLADQDIVGRSHYEIFPEIPDRWKIIHQNALAGKIEACEEDSFPRLDGSMDWVRWEVRPWYEHGGDIGGIIIFSEMITERKQIELALQESLDQLHLAHKAAHSGTWEWEVTSGENTWSDEIWELYGLDPGSVKPSYEAWLQTIHPDDLAGIEQMVENTVQNGSELNMEYRVKAPDGTERWLMARGQPVLDDQGKMVRYIGIVIDITERKKMEEEVFRALAELERSNKELEQFAYVASHDLQEPLRMVSSFTQLLARRYADKLDQDARDYIDFAVKGANRMQKMIQDLLGYSRVVTRGKPPEPTDMGRVLEEALANLHLTIRDSGASITHEALPAVMGDHSQLVQVIQNLMGNAIKFRRDEPLHIHVSARKSGDEWIIAVKDNGMGIEPQYFERIFLLFERLHAGEKYRGTGIGLALCKRIIERLGGRIWVESDPGKGTTFSFTLQGEH